MGADRGGEVIKGTLEMIVLEILQHEPMHGWGITERIERRSQGLLSINQGSLYPALYRLPDRRSLCVSRSPSFAVVCLTAILTVALGISASTAIFSVTRPVILGCWRWP